MNGTTPGTHLGNTPLNLAKLRELSRKELPEILDKVRGKKGLVLDPTLTGPLSLIAEFNLLKNHGVEKIYHLESDTLETDCPGLIYICRPKLKYMRYIASHIKHFSKSSKIDCWLFFVPERTMICERVLEEEGVKGDITIGSYAMDWIPYEDDLISMELDPSTWKEIYLDGDQTAIYYAARSIMRLQSIYGLFPRIMGKGDAARQLADMLLRMRKEHAVTDQVSTKAPSLLNTVSNHIDQFIIIDRNVDLVTPLCTQLTYEGLIDETMGIKHCVVELDPSLITLAASKGPSTPTTSATPMKKKKYVLNSSDKLFGQLRDQNFAVVGGILNKVAKRINENYEERHNAKTMAQIRDFVGRLGELQQEHQSLRVHTGIAEEIIANTVTDDFNKVLEVQQNVVAGVDGSREPEYIEEMINRQKPLVQVLRLLCLMSLAQGGLKQKLFDHFEKEIVQTYGYEHIETLHRLEKLGLWMKRTNNKSTFGQCRRLLKLIVDDVDEFHPNDISYVYSGYAPLSIRLVQSAMQKSPNFTTGTSTTSLFSYMGTSTANFVKETTSGWRGAEDILRLLPGQSFDLKQTVEYGPETNAAMARAKRHGLQHGKTTIIFFLGGCTHTEVSAIRFLAQHDEGRDYLVATTQMINGSTFLTPIIQHRNE
ncbi:vacuolar protein sorting-associated protein 33A [Rhizopus microsporus ATCC 52813]|uniref:Vacuolar protein sorting-associated protein 33A n=1 Tax=Rhizopus microsporus ATCC 52813 TaxID=1340429 RepID=A0A2G4SRL9_RHIZD|nr:vacuolar protein sorting-associated protein 33A [Rhizopus microsporus ATCC 52813]PHZ11395.1 vacuolar protein sorting-associated protein 33A [Rhizopus microsporus ATCC 52813]